MSKTIEFVEMIASRIGCGYVYVSQGEIMTQYGLNQLVKLYGKDHYFGTDKDAGLVSAG